MELEPILQPVWPAGEVRVRGCQAESVPAGLVDMQFSWNPSLAAGQIEADSILCGDASVFIGLKDECRWRLSGYPTIGAELLSQGIIVCRPQQVFP